MTPLWPDLASAPHQILSGCALDPQDCVRVKFYARIWPRSGDIARERGGGQDYAPIRLAGGRETQRLPVQAEHWAQQALMIQYMRKMSARTGVSECLATRSVLRF